MHPSNSKAEGKLPHVRIVGFTGHRHLKNPEAVAAALREELADLKKGRGELIAISSIAVGADTLFAREVLKAGIKWVVLLPTTEELFQHDFTPEEWAVAKSLMQQAAERRPLPGTERPQIYVDVGKATVDQADCLIAVWDGLPAQGPGGTAEIVDYAQILRRKTILFREEGSGVKKVESPPRSSRATPEVLLHALGPYVELPPPPQILVDHFKTCDAEAARTAPRFRFYTLMMAACHLLATLAGGLGLALHAHESASGWFVILVGLMKFYLVAAALGIMLYFWRTHRQEVWLRQRRAAEYCRSVLATWHCYYSIEPDSFHEVHQLMALARSALFLRLEYKRDDVTVQAFRVAYAHNRVMDQLKYFRQEAKKAKAWMFPLRVAYLSFTLLAFATSAMLINLQTGNSTLFLDYDHLTPGWKFFRYCLEVSPLTFPALASFTITWMAINEVDRRLGRFHDLQEQMRLALIDLTYCTSWEGIRVSVEKTEKLLFKEVLEWYSMAQDSKA
jgi:hypothetical protein